MGMSLILLHCPPSSPRHRTPQEIWLPEAETWNSDLRIAGVRERICIMEKAARSHTTSSKLFTLRDDKSEGRKIRMRHP